VRGRKSYGAVRETEESATRKDAGQLYRGSSEFQERHGTPCLLGFGSKGVGGLMADTRSEPVSEGLGDSYGTT